MITKKLSIIIPVFNEEKTIGPVLRKINEISLKNYKKEIIVVNDFSSDNSRKILGELEKKYNFIFLNHKKNLGKGAALRTGIGKSSGDIVLIQDADLEYDPDDWSKIIAEFDNPDVSVVFGSRNINPKRRGYPHYILGVYLITKITNLLFHSKLTDCYTCYKAFRKELIKSLSLFSDGFEIEAEITAKILKRDIKIMEVPINYYPRKFSEGKKIKMRDGIAGMWTIIKIRWK